MLFKLAADLVVLFHLLWILFILAGAVIGRLIAWVKWLHVGALVFSLLLQLFRWTCPLTYLEVWLRRQHDPSLGYTGDFLAHYAERLVYLQVSPFAVFLTTLLVVGFSAWAYGFSPRRH
jgi:cytochrome c biogenesis protein CcdA